MRERIYAHPVDLVYECLFNTTACFGSPLQPSSGRPLPFILFVNQCPVWWWQKWTVETCSSIE